jgi:hypothetical protein
MPIRLSVRPDVSFADFLEELQACYGLACRYRVPGAIISRTIKEVGASTIAPTYNFVSAISEAASAISSNTSNTATSSSPEQLSLAIPKEFGSSGWHESHETNLFDMGRYIEGHVKYMPLKYRSETIQHFVDSFMTCLERIAEDPRKAIGGLAVGG